jgi:hypothetical protein
MKYFSYTDPALNNMSKDEMEDIFERTILIDYNLGFETFSRFYYSVLSICWIKTRSDSLKLIRFFLILPCFFDKITCSIQLCGSCLQLVRFSRNVLFQFLVVIALPSLCTHILLIDSRKNYIWIKSHTMGFQKSS